MSKSLNELISSEYEISPDCVDSLFDYVAKKKKFTIYSDFNTTSCSLNVPFLNIHKVFINGLELSCVSNSRVSFNKNDDQTQMDLYLDQISIRLDPTVLQKQVLKILKNILVNIDKLKSGNPVYILENTELLDKIYLQCEKGHKFNAIEIDSFFKVLNEYLSSFRTKRIHHEIALNQCLIISNNILKNRNLSLLMAMSMSIDYIVSDESCFIDFELDKE